MRLVTITIALIILVSTAYADEGVPEYRLQAGDQVKFMVWGESGLGINTQVLTDGSISFPLVGRIVVDGMTLTEIEEECRGRLQIYLVDPVVTVIVTAPHVPKIKVLGKVKEPGKFTIKPGDTLIDAIAYAGGFEERCEIKRILILNHGYAKFINLRAYLELEEERVKTDLTLYDGDLIIVPEVGRPDWAKAMPFVTALIQSLIVAPY